MEPTVSSATVRAIVTLAGQRGIALPASFRDERYPLSEVVELWRRVHRSAGDDDIGRAAAALVPFGAFGIAEHMMLLSGTVESALRRIVRYYPLVNQAFGLIATRTARGVRLELHSADGAPIFPTYADFVLTSIARRIGSVTAGRSPQIEQHLRPSPHLFIDAIALRERLPLGDEELCEIVESVAQRRLASERRNTTDIVAEIVAVALRGGAPRLTDIARRLGTSSRSVQRRLILEGTSFRLVVDEVRRTMALSLLQQRVVTKQIADRLGFGEVRSFHRAFRRWTGTTPARFKVS